MMIDWLSGSQGAAIDDFTAGVPSLSLLQEERSAGIQ